MNQREGRIGNLVPVNQAGTRRGFEGGRQVLETHEEIQQQQTKPPTKGKSVIEGETERAVLIPPSENRQCFPHLFRREV